MNQPLRILMIRHMPWSRNLGGSRVKLESADEFQTMEHQVEKVLKLLYEKNWTSEAVFYRLEHSLLELNHTQKSY